MNDYEAIRALEARYFRLMDTKDWTGFRELFCDDVVIDVSGSGGEVITGADEFLAFLTPRIGDAVTIHHGHTPEIELLSDTEATGIWAMEDRLTFPDGTRLHGFGHYHETYAKTGGRWRIRSQRLTRLHMDFTPAQSDPPGRTAG
ncbi:nuclear transport factor 2 family protein [Nocardia carnea]|uniref:Nuclear transport factor 2 family protein n=1 Tax=Nocardia carnea TaxID=37328 RepID=A0ABW7TVV2_9NOCA|nr:nuclear transport factor 2 family protein [Nocardia carnea]